MFRLGRVIYKLKNETTKPARASTETLRCTFEAASSPSGVAGSSSSSLPSASSSSLVSSTSSASVEKVSRLVDYVLICLYVPASSSSSSSSSSLLLPSATSSLSADNVSEFERRRKKKEISNKTQLWFYVPDTPSTLPSSSSRMPPQPSMH